LLRLQSKKPGPASGPFLGVEISSQLFGRSFSWKEDGGGVVPEFVINAVIRRRTGQMDVSHRVSYQTDFEAQKYADDLRAQLHKQHRRASIDVSVLKLEGEPSDGIIRNR